MKKKLKETSDERLGIRVSKTVKKYLTLRSNEENRSISSFIVNLVKKDAASRVIEKSNKITLD